MNKSNNRLLTFMSKTQTVSAWAKELKIDPGTIHWRLSKGKTTEEALVKPSETEMVILYKGETMSLARVAKLSGVNYKLLQSRLKRGMGIEVSVGTPVGMPMPHSKFLTHKGETLPMRAWERRMGFQHGTIRLRLKAGWTVQEALETVSQKSKK